jgi:Bacteriophage Lambda NinG protein
MYLHGNLIRYRQGLVSKYGEDEVLRLEEEADNNRTKKWSRDELEIIIETYK